MQNRRVVALFLALAAVWGSAFVATEAALASFPPVLLAAFRFDVAAAVLFAAALVRGESVRSLRPVGRGDWFPVLTGGAFTIGLHHALLFAGQQYVTAAVASTLLGLIPVLTPAVDRLVRPNRPLPTSTVVGLLVGFVGVALIANPDPSNLLGTARGTALVLGSAVAFVLGAVFTDARASTLPPLGRQAWMALVGALLLHAAAVVLPGESLAATTMTPVSVGWVLYLAVVPGALGFFAYFHLLHHVGPVQVGLLEYAIPPFAALFAWLLWGTPLDPATAVGFVAILAGFLLVKSRAIGRVLRRTRAEA